MGKYVCDRIKTHSSIVEWKTISKKSVAISLKMWTLYESNKHNIAKLIEIIIIMILIQCIDHVQK